MVVDVRLARGLAVLTHDGADRQELAKAWRVGSCQRRHSATDGALAEMMSARDGAPGIVKWQGLAYPRSVMSDSHPIMNKYMLLHFGFEKPTPDIMEAWGKWFAEIADRTVENGGLRSGREISKDGAKDLGWDMESITGYTIITAQSLEEAEEIASGNPFISGIRVYEVMSHGG